MMFEKQLFLVYFLFAIFQASCQIQKKKNAGPGSFFRLTIQKWTIKWTIQKWTMVPTVAPVMDWDHFAQNFFIRSKKASIWVFRIVLEEFDFIVLLNILRLGCWFPQASEVPNFILSKLFFCSRPRFLQIFISETTHENVKLHFWNIVGSF